MFSMRYATEHDEVFWFSLDKHLARSEYALKVRDRRAYVIGDGETLIGIFRYNLFLDIIPFLTEIYLEESHRGKGFGRRAMAFWENEMRDDGHPMVMLSTMVDEDAQHFYRKLGYADKGSVVFDIPPFEQPLEMFMAKRL